MKYLRKNIQVRNANDNDNKGDFFVNVMYAVNHQATEDAITGRLNDDYNVVFAATYRESVLETLLDTPVDILIIRDALNGDIPIMDMVERIRIEYSEIRIVYICGKKTRGDKELTRLVGLGVYDIISKDKIPIDEVSQCVKYPRKFRDVAEFYISDYLPQIDVVEVEKESSNKNASGGFLGGFGLFNKGKKAIADEDEPRPSTPQVDIQLLRKTIKEESIREAQAEMDSLIRAAVDDEVRKIENNASELTKKITEQEGKIQQKDVRIHSLANQVSELQRQKDTLREEIDTINKNMSESLQIYEDQIKSLSTERDTPTFYAEQQQKWTDEKLALESKIKQYEADLGVADDKIDTLNKDIERLNNKLSLISDETAVLKDENSTLDIIEQEKKTITETRDLLLKEKEDLISKNKALNEEIRELRDTSNQDARVLKESISELERLVASTKDMSQTKEEDLKSEIARLKQKLSDIPVLSPEDLEKQEKLNKSLKSTEEERDSLYKKISELKSEKEDLQKSIIDIKDDGNLTKTKNSDLQRELTALRNELELRPAIDESEPFEYTFSLPALQVPYLPDTATYPKPSSPVRVATVIGGKHGIGTTTTALNLAASLANRGKKTLLVELNHKLPMTNEFFELVNVPLGLEESFSAMATKDFQKVDASIIRFHTQETQNKALAKTYKKMPAGLHILTYSTKSLVGSLVPNNSPQITTECMRDLIGYLKNTQQYSHIIFDIQPDERYLLDIVLRCGVDIDRFMIAMTQDPHGVSVAGSLISHLHKSEAQSLLSSAELIICKYTQSGLNAQKIRKHLHFKNNQVSTLTEDSAGYHNASMLGVPYVLNKGKFSSEYDGLSNKLF